MHGTNDTNGNNISTGYGGTAGENYEVAFNAIRGAQPYYCFIFCLKTLIDAARQADNRIAL